jgi:hypothetical protein
MPMIFANLVTSVATLKTLPGARKLGTPFEIETFFTSVGIISHRFTP